MRAPGAGGTSSPGGAARFSPSAGGVVCPRAGRPRPTAGGSRRGLRRAAGLTRRGDGRRGTPNCRPRSSGNCGSCWGRRSASSSAAGRGCWGMWMGARRRGRCAEWRSHARQERRSRIVRGAGSSRSRRSRLVAPGCQTWQSFKERIDRPARLARSTRPTTTRRPRQKLARSRGSCSPPGSTRRPSESFRDLADNQMNAAVLAERARFMQAECRYHARPVPRSRRHLPQAPAGLPDRAHRRDCCARIFEIATTGSTTSATSSTSACRREGRAPLAAELAEPVDRTQAVRRSGRPDARSAGTTSTSTTSPARPRTRRSSGAGT